MNNKNAMIARFMGFSIEKFKNSGGSGYTIELNGTPTEHCIKVSKYGRIDSVINDLLSNDVFKYHISYDWLIPVWIKFRTIEVLDNRRMQHNIFKDRIRSALSAANIELIYEQLVEGITWYNSIVAQLYKQ